MSKSDNEFVNLSQDHELKNWLYRNQFSKSEDNVLKLKGIINQKVKKGHTSDNITWVELDNALKNNRTWFNSLAAVTPA
ncbi:hypothetical protein [Pseudomonas carassii]|jgi:hypothetical protein|uniref:Uncharacterized protein n=1 Tax=Pseudomonas carassii TaxID=3115855 RepID=A0ABU7H4P9_9PSED|nr:hypothetical protein [Pseudomonas sp. 137P]MEE1886297.1 hypothetical protein [Pseudomonas sp. 137P]